MGPLDPVGPEAPLRGQGVCVVGPGGRRPLILNQALQVPRLTGMHTASLTGSTQPRVIFVWFLCADPLAESINTEGIIFPGFHRFHDSQAR